MVNYLIQGIVDIFNARFAPGQDIDYLSLTPGKEEWVVKREDLKILLNTLKELAEVEKPKPFNGKKRHPDDVYTIFKYEPKDRNVIYDYILHLRAQINFNLPTLKS